MSSSFLEKVLLYLHSVKYKLKIFLKSPSNLFFYIDYYLSELLDRSKSIAVVSFPKSGRTWLEVMLVNALLYEFEGECSGEYKKPLRRLLREKKLPSMYFTHANSSWESLVLDEMQIKDMSLDSFSDKKTIFLYRDPRDVMVSCYYHMKYRTGINISKDRLIDSPNLGFRKLINFMNLWYDYTEKNPELSMRISYEEMKQSPCESVKKLFDFTGISVSSESIDKAVEASRFDKMQHNEKENKNSTPWLKPVDASNKNSYKTRKGKVGEHKEFFSAEQLDRINGIIRDELNPAFDYS